MRPGVGQPLHPGVLSWITESGFLVAQLTGSATSQADPEAPSGSLRQGGLFPRMFYTQVMPGASHAGTRAFLIIKDRVGWEGFSRGRLRELGEPGASEACASSFLSAASCHVPPLHKTF